jgi:AcrR family transcriptional regulator
MKRPATRRPDARQRLLDAAARVFARDGLTGATTRAIAREAGVNEVTLFRHFQSKDRLLTAVVGQNFGPQASGTQPALPVLDGELRADLTAYARRYEQLLEDNLPLIRAMLGEIHHHHSDQEKQVFKAIFRPLRETLVARLQGGARGDVRAGGKLDAEILADLFGGMIFTAVLRRASSHAKKEYSDSEYLARAVDLMVKGSGA